MSESPTIKCPHCGYERPESSPSYKWQNSFITDCENCDKLFHVEVVKAYRTKKDWRKPESKS